MQAGGTKLTFGKLVQQILGGAFFVLAIPLIAVVALLVALSLGRPVLFRQWRSGVGGGTFLLLKFRTMTDARGADGTLLPDAERVTPVGQLLRRTRIDELPELINIARGEMAFVGPRPLLPETVSEMGEKGKVRGTVLPGLTGWSQVSGNTLLSNSQKLALDLWYIEHRSLLLDLRILLMTIAVIVRGERLAKKAAPTIGDDR